MADCERAALGALSREVVELDEPALPGEGDCEFGGDQGRAPGCDLVGEAAAEHVFTGRAVHVDVLARALWQAANQAKEFRA